MIDIEIARGGVATLRRIHEAYRSKGDKTSEYIADVAQLGMMLGDELVALETRIEEVIKEVGHEQKNEKNL